MSQTHPTDGIIRHRRRFASAKLLKKSQTTMMICYVTYHYWRYLAQKAAERLGVFRRLGVSRASWGLCAVGL